MTENQKILINDSGTQKNIRLTFPNHEINDIENNRVYLDGMSLEESLFDGDNLTFGKCNASLFKIKVADFTEDIKDAEMDVYVTFANPDTAVTSLTVPFGKYIVQSAERTSDRRWRDITAIDFMSKFDVDIADWYNSTLYPTSATTHTIAEIRTALCQHIGVTQASVTLINDSLVVGKTIEPSSLNARDFLQNICEVNGCFGHFDWNGVMQYISLEATHGLYPSVSLYPSTSLYPRRVTNESGITNENISVFRNCDYKDYDVEQIDSVAIMKEDGSLAVHYDVNPNYKNRYNIVGNVLLYEFSTSELQAIAQTIFDKISDCAYRPNQTVIFSGIYMPLGQPYSVDTRIINENTVIDTSFTSFILKRQINGIQAMFQTLEADGSQYQPDISTNDVLTEIKIQKGKSAKYERDFEHLSLEFADFEAETEAQFVITANKIESTVAKTQNKAWLEEHPIGTPITIKYKGYGLPLYSTSPELNPYTNFTLNDLYLNVETGKVYKLTDVSAVVGRYDFTWTYQYDLTSIQDETYSRIEQTAESVKSTVANAQNTWIEEYPIGTPISIKFRGYGSPKANMSADELDEYYPNIEVGDNYLNVYTGNVVTVHAISTLHDGTIFVEWWNVGRLTSEKDEMYSTIEQTAEGITTTVAKTQNIWLEEQPIGTAITIKYRGYGSPVGKAFSYLSLRDLYLDVDNGYVYKMTDLNNQTWTYQYTLTTTQSHTETQISQTNNQIVLKADANGNMVLVELGANPSTGTSFTVKADDISLEGKTIDLTADDITIQSNHFTVDEFGNTHIEGDGVYKVTEERYPESNDGYKADITSQYVNKTYRGKYAPNETLPSGGQNQFLVVMDAYNRWHSVGNTTTYIKLDGYVNPNSQSSPYPPSQQYEFQYYIDLSNGKYYLCYNGSQGYEWFLGGICEYLTDMGTIRTYSTLNDEWIRVTNTYVYPNTSVFDINGTDGLTIDTPQFKIDKGSAELKGSISIGNGAFNVDEDGNLSINDSFTVDNQGNLNINDKFTIDKNGNAVADSLTVEDGTITGGTINGTDISGVDIQTETLTIKDQFDLHYYETEEGYTYKRKSATFTGHSTSGDEDRTVLRLDLGDAYEGNGVLSVIGDRSVFNCDVYAESYNNLSDGRTKENIEQLSQEYEKAYYEIQPIVFNYIGKTERELGMIAQDIESLLIKHNINKNNCFIKKIPDEKLGMKYTLDYTKFIPYNIHMIQKQHNEINNLKEELATLKEQVAFLMGKEQRNG